MWEIIIWLPSSSPKGHCVTFQGKLHCCRFRARQQLTLASYHFLTDITFHMCCTIWCYINVSMNTHLGHTLRHFLAVFLHWNVVDKSVMWRYSHWNTYLWVPFIQITPNTTQRNSDWSRQCEEVGWKSFNTSNGYNFQGLPLDKCVQDVCWYPQVYLHVVFPPLWSVTLSNIVQTQRALRWYLRVYVGSCGHILGVEAKPLVHHSCGAGSKSRLLPGKSGPTEGDENALSTSRKYNRTGLWRFFILKESCTKDWRYTS